MDKYVYLIILLFVLAGCGKQETSVPVVQNEIRKQSKGDTNIKKIEDKIEFKERLFKVEGLEIRRKKFSVDGEMTGIIEYSDSGIKIKHKHNEYSYNNDNHLIEAPPREVRFITINNDENEIIFVITYWPRTNGLTYHLYFYKFKGDDINIIYITFHVYPNRDDPIDHFETSNNFGLPENAKMKNYFEKYRKEIERKRVNN